MRPLNQARGDRLARDAGAARAQGRARHRRRRQDRGGGGGDVLKLIRYEAACRALAAARRVDEVKAIRNLAEQMRLYAKQSHDQVMLADSQAILERAVRRLGEVIEKQKETIGLNKGTAGKGRPKNRRGKNTPPKKDDRPTFSENDIDKNLAKRARKLASMRNSFLIPLVRLSY
jgi:hypothetical protein